MGRIARVVVRAGFGLAMLLPLAGFAADQKVTGSFAVSGEGGGNVKVNFTCFGLPTCTGVYSAELRDDGCSNSFFMSDSLTIGGVNPSVGAFQGSITFQRDWTSNSPAPGAPSQVCTYGFKNKSFSIAYSATWNGTSGTLAISGVDDDGTPYGGTGNGAYKAPDFTSDHFAPVTIQFSGPDAALMTLPNGRTTALIRQRF